MKIYALIIISALFLAGEGLSAQTFRRGVELEWEPVEGARSYDLEVLSLSNNKTFNFEIRKALWNGKLIPGPYSMRVRAKDRRGVPGEWSDFEEFVVGLAQPRAISPKPDAKLLSMSHRNSEVIFKWEAVPGAKSYTFELYLDNSVAGGEGKTLLKRETKTNSLTLSLDVAQAYMWSVKGHARGVESQEPLSAKFSLWGGPLDSPEIEEPESDYVREIQWSRPNRASSYAYTLERKVDSLDAAGGGSLESWEMVAQQNDLTTNKLNFDNNWYGGTYRMTLIAQGPLIQSSKPSRLSFVVRSGDRSIASEETATLRQSIERVSGWMGVASYLITMVDYQGVNFDKSNSTLKYSAVGGTGRLGLGYFSPQSPWGFLGVADLSGISVEGSGNYTYATVESNAIYRRALGPRGELRQFFGFSYKELPETVGRSKSDIADAQLLKALGPHYGVEYWYAWNSKLGFQVNTHFYPSLFTIETSNGQDISPTLSWQFGVLGSYRLRRNVTGLIGWAYRQDQIDYKAKAGMGSAESGDLNSVTLSGHYLNLFLEWAL